MHIHPVFLFWKFLGGEGSWGWVDRGGVLVNFGGGYRC